MPYAARVITLLFVFFSILLAACVYLVVVSLAWASDDLHVGHGSTSFPPQGPALYSRGTP